MRPHPDGSGPVRPGGSRLAGALALLVALAIAAPLALILLPRADLLRNGPERQPSTFQPEELATGTVAQDLLEGPILPLGDYQHAPHVGGSVVVGVVAVPFFALFGPSVAALKLTGLVFKALALVCLFLILDRSVSRRAAWFGGILFACAAPGYTQLSICAWGTHVESNAFALALLLLFLGAWVRPGPPRLGLAFLAGLVAGFGTYFCFILLILVALLAAFRFLHDKLFFLRRDFAVALLGGAVGLMPWLVYNLRHAFASLEAFEHAAGTRAAPETLADRAERARLFVLEILPRSFFFSDLGPLPGRVPEVFFATSFIVVALAGLWLAPGPRAAFSALARALVRLRVEPTSLPVVLLFLGYPLAFFAAFVANSGFKIGVQPDRAPSYRYAMVLYPFFCLALGAGFEALCRAGLARLAAAWTAALAVLALAGAAALLDPGQWGVNAALPGYDHDQLGRFVVATYPDEPDIVLRAVELAEERRTPEELTRLYQGMARFLRTVLLSDPERLHLRLREDLEHFEPLRARLQATVSAPYRHFFERPSPSRAPALQPRDE